MGAVGHDANKATGRHRPVMKPKKPKRREKGELSAKAKVVLRQVHRDLNWLAENEEQLQQDFPGELIAIHNANVVAHGRDRRKVIVEACRRERCERAELVVVSMLPAEVEFAPDSI